VVFETRGGIERLALSVNLTSFLPHTASADDSKRRRVRDRRRLEILIE
jgi:hypothetical protein